jgi:hypothetical protein
MKYTKMENRITQSGIAIEKKDSLIYGASEDVIINESKKIRNLVRRFKAFCEQQQENRLGWTAFTLAAQVFLLAPLTLMAIALNGNRFALWIPVILSSFAVVLCNLMALPTKITIPVFCLSVLINAGVIMLSFLI